MEMNSPRMRNTKINNADMDPEMGWEYDTEYEDSLEALREDTDKIVEWWMEDYPFEALLEQFDLTPKDAFFALVETDKISRELLETYLTSDA